MRESTKGDVERIHSLDVLRGFAIGGILFANVLWISGYLSASLARQKNTLSAHPLDEVFLVFTRLFVHGKLYAIFAFLFGLGFSVQLLRARTNQTPNFVARYIWRLMILFLIGCAHAWFFWSGDILRFYAVLGVFLVLLRNQSDRVLLITAACTALIPVALAMFYQLGMTPLTELVSVKIDRHQTLAVLAQGGWERFFEMNGQRIEFFAYSNIENGRVFKIFAMLVLGFYAGRRGIFHRVDTHRNLFRSILIWGGMLGGTVSLIRVAQTHAVLPDTPSEVIQQCLYALSVYPLALAYVACVTLIGHKKEPGPWSRGLAAVGRMALSNYLLQTVLLATVFYWWGFALVGTLPLRYCGALVVAIFLFQMVLSHLWLKHFNQGPMEWFWRACTKLKWPPIWRNRPG